MLRCIPEPFSIDGLNTPTTSGSVDEPVTVIWDDGTMDQWALTDPVAFGPAASYGTAVADTTIYAWLLVAVKGASGPVLVREMDQTTMDVVLGGTPTRAVLRRIADGLFYPLPQV